MSGQMPRPAYFNLVQIQMPVGALTSMTHRVTGILLAVVIRWGCNMEPPSGADAASVVFTHNQHSPYHAST